MFEIKAFYFNPIRVCCYVVSSQSKECVIIDPGCENVNEFERIKNYITSNQLNPSMILLTHGHFDHTMGLSFVQKQWNIKTYLHQADKALYAQTKWQCAQFGMNVEQPSEQTEDLSQVKEIIVGDSYLNVIHTPGHTQGCVCFSNPQDKILLSGDTLFCGSIGRTDLPGGNHEQIIRSIEKNLLTLDGRTVVYPGHGVATSIEQEILDNPFLCGKDK